LGNIDVWTNTLKPQVKKLDNVENLVKISHPKGSDGIVFFTNFGE